MFAGPFAKAAALIDSIARNHTFVDGNKRTSYLIGAYFLKLNEYDLAPQSGEIETFMIWIVTQKPHIDEIARWLEEGSTAL